MSNDREIIIIAPHPDDEIIGCYEIFRDEDIRPIIIYTSVINEMRKEETKRLKNYAGVSLQLYLHKIPSKLLSLENRFYFPDPIYEIHPEHRKWGAIGENLLRRGLDVIFYNVNMQAPYIHEVKDPDNKLEFMENVYPSQRELWGSDAKYFLFEGRCKWLV